jgi:hypothetical protein
MYNALDTNVLNEKIIELKYMKKKIIVSKAIIDISGLSHGGLRLKSPFNWTCLRCIC